MLEKLATQKERDDKVQFHHSLLLLDLKRFQGSGGVDTYIVNDKIQGWQPVGPIQVLEKIGVDELKPLLVFGKSPAALFIPVYPYHSAALIQIKKSQSFADAVGGACD